MGSEGVALRAPWLVRSTSPLHCVLAFAAGAGLQHALGLPAPQGPGREAMQAIGTVLANAGLLLVLWCFVLFARARTTLLPGESPARLILHGPFRWSRNPIYVGMLASYAGLALMLAVPWSLALLPVPMLILQRTIVPFEEERLHARFPGAYGAYASRVRRWW